MKALCKLEAVELSVRHAPPDRAKRSIARRAGHMCAFFSRAGGDAFVRWDRSRADSNARRATRSSVARAISTVRNVPKRARDVPPPRRPRRVARTASSEPSRRISVEADSERDDDGCAATTGAR